MELIKQDVFGGNGFGWDFQGAVLADFSWLM